MILVRTVVIVVVVIADPVVIVIVIVVIVVVAAAAFVDCGVSVDFATGLLVGGGGRAKTGGTGGRERVIREGGIAVRLRIVKSEGTDESVMGGNLLC